MSFEPRRRIPSARQILKRVAFHAATNPVPIPGSDNDFDSVQWDSLIENCCAAMCDGKRQYEIMVARATALLDRTVEELERTGPDGSKVSDDDILYFILVEM